MTEIETEEEKGMVDKMSKLREAVEDMLLDRTGRNGLQGIINKFALPVKDMTASTVVTMFTTLLAQSGVTVADSSGIGYASRTVELSDGKKGYMALKVSKRRNARSIVPSVEVSFTSNYRKNPEESDESYKGTMLTADFLERTLGGDISTIAESLVAYDNLMANILDELRYFEDDSQLGSDVHDLYDDLIGDRIIYRSGGLLFISEIEFNKNGLPTGDIITSLDCDEIVTNQVFKSDRLGVKKQSVSTYTD